MGLWNTRRFISMNALLGIFTVIIYNGQLAVALLVVGVQLSVSYEVWCIGISPELERQVPYFNKLRWYILIIGHLYIADGWILMDLILKSNNSVLISLFTNHILYSLILSLLGLIYFVIQINAHCPTIAILHYQYGQLAWILSSFLCTVIGSPFAIRLAFDGLIWTVLPMLTVVANDVFAYGFGKSFGKHPLTPLSPKKTWEGYIYGGIATIPFGYWLAHMFMKYDVSVCPKYEFSFGLRECERDSIFVKKEYSFGDGYVLNMEPFQIYNVMISIWIAIVCPIGGFMASGYKRAFGLKNYGSIIPGHGGITDRMDAEMLMCAFVFFVHKVVMRDNHCLSVDEIQTQITSLKDEDVSLIIKVLETLVN